MHVAGNAPLKALRAAEIGESTALGGRRSQIIKRPTSSCRITWYQARWVPGQAEDGQRNESRGRGTGRARQSGKSVNRRLTACPLLGQSGMLKVCGADALPRGRLVTVTVPLASVDAGMNTSTPLWNG